MDHDVWQLPEEFIFRIGELNKGVLKTELLEAVQQIGEVINNAEKHIWTLTSQVFVSHGRTWKKGVDMSQSSGRSTQTRIHL